MSTSEPQHPHHRDHPRFEVVNQHHEETYNARGEREGQMHVHFRTPSGIESKVVVPMQEYTAENVHHRLRYEAGEIEKVQHLTGEHEPTPPPAA